MPVSVKFLRQLETIEPSLRTIFIDFLDEIERQQEAVITQTDFNELKQIVKELVEAQQHVERTLKELGEIQQATIKQVQELTLAQQKTEDRLDRLEQVVIELAEAQKQTEQRLNELAEAQKQTEQRLNELAEAQKKIEGRLDRVEQTVAELVEAQKKTGSRLDRLEQRVEVLSCEQKEIKKQLGGLTAVVGYGLEDKLYPYLEEFARKVFGIVPAVIDLRKNIIYGQDKFDEVNIYIEGHKSGTPVLLVGECKVQPGRKDIESFIKLVNRLKNNFHQDVYSFIVGYHFHPSVEEYMQSVYPELKYYKSFVIEYKKY